MKFRKSQSKPAKFAAPNPSDAARVRVVDVEGSGYSLAPTCRTATAALQFNGYIKRVINSLSHEPFTSNQLTVACAIAFELLREEDLLPFLNGLSTAQTLGDKVYVAWNVTNVLQRRELSPFTIMAFGKADQNTDWAVEVRTFRQAITNVYDFGATISRERTLTAVFLDLQAWAYTYLPMPLAANYLNVLPITHLKDTTWYRRNHLTVNVVGEPKTKLRDDLQSAEANVVEVIVESPTPLSGFWIIEQLSKICSGLTGVGVSISDARAWRKLVLRITRVTVDLKRAGPIEALMVGWAIHLVRYGSAQKKNPRVSTLARYLSAALSQIYSSVRAVDVHPFDIDTRAWKAIFEKLLNERGADSSFNSAVLSFHSFLVRTIDAEPQFWMFHGKDSEHSPRANVIWPHEVQAIPECIRQAESDDRLGLQVCTWATLLTNTALRISELKWIRLGDFSVMDGELTLHIVSRRYAGSGKTGAAARDCFIKNEDCITAMETWRARREEEGADTTDLLFGDPHDRHRIYKMGKSYCLLNQALKSVTGDPDFSSHLCRHSVISLAVESAILSSSEYQEINPIHKIQVQAGHKSAELTIGTYFHLPEKCQRYWIDHAIGQLGIAYEPISLWTKQKVATLAQRKHRGRETNWTFMDAIRDAAKADFPPNKLESMHLNSVTPEDLTPRRLEFTQVISSLSDLKQGFKVSAVCLRNSISEEQVQTISTALTELSACIEDDKDPSKVQTGFNRCHHPQWEFFYKSILKFPKEELNNALAFWTSCARGGAISLTTGMACRPFLQLLKHCGIGANRIVVRLNGDPMGESGSSKQVSVIASAFRSVHGIAPQIECTKFRRGRLACYLLVLTKPPRAQQAASAATNDTLTLNALLLSLVVYLKLKSKENINAS